jgi:proteic killer suppression protein
MAIKSFADQGTKDIFEGVNSKLSRRTLPQDLWKVGRRTLDLLNRVTSTLELNAPGLHTKPLKWDRPGFTSIRITDVYRIHFRFEQGNAFEVEINADHGRHTS